MNIFYETVLEEITRRGYEVVLREVTKNNVKHIGIQFTDKKSNMQPVVYIDHMEGDCADIAEKAITLFEKARVESLNVTEFMNYDFFKEHLSIALQRKSEEDIEKKPFLEDMEQYLILIWDGKTMRITSESLKYVGMNSEEAWQFAQKNLNNSTRIISMIEALAEIAGNLEDMEMLLPDNPMDIIQANNGHKGASGILNTELLREYAEKKGVNKLAFIPSSIHEGIIIPYNENGLSIEEIGEFVKLVNAEEVEPEDQLSDRAYIIEV